MERLKGKVEKKMTKEIAELKAELQRKEEDIEQRKKKVQETKLTGIEKERKHTNEVKKLVDDQ